MALKADILLLGGQWVGGVCVVEVLEDILWIVARTQMRGRHYIWLLRHGRWRDQGMARVIALVQKVLRNPGILNPRYFCMSLPTVQEGNLTEALTNIL